MPKAILATCPSYFMFGSIPCRTRGPAPQAKLYFSADRVLRKKDWTFHFDFLTSKDDFCFVIYVRLNKCSAHGHCITQ